MRIISSEIIYLYNSGNIFAAGKYTSIVTAVCLAVREVGMNKFYPIILPQNFKRNMLLSISLLAAILGVNVLFFHNPADSSPALLPEHGAEGYGSLKIMGLIDWLMEIIDGKGV